MEFQHCEADASKKAMQSASSHYFLSSFLPKDARQLYCVLITVLVCFLLFLLSFSPSSPSPLRSPFTSATEAAEAAGFSLNSSPLPTPPSFAYFLSGSTNDADRLFRLVLAIYHPKNLYLLHLDLTAPQEQRDRLARDLRAVPTFKSAGNVHILGGADFANPRGSSALASTLHGAAVLLRLSGGWDWFINLGASDYPLVTQDDLLHVFSFLPKDLNFVQHSSYIGWRESHMLKHVIVDPGLYLSTKADVFYATQKRDLPNAYRIFTGSPSVILSRKFVEHIILGADNLPRALLMYYANTPAAHKNYLHTVLCNSPEFNRTIMNDHLHHSKSPSKQDQSRILLDDLNNIILSGAAFGSVFSRDDPVLNQIDRKVLNRGRRRVVPGGWCLGRGNTDPCGVWGNPDALIPGPGGTRLAKKIVELLTNESLQSHRCVWDGSM